MSNVNLRDVYLDYLGEMVTFNQSNPRPRVRHIQKWKDIQSTIREGDRINLDEYSFDNIHVWSDLHFGHKNIISFSERPFSNLQQMDNTLIENHNEYVEKDHVSIWVGDVAFMGDSFANELIDRCNGYKILIVGNHDFDHTRLKKLNFDEIHLMYEYSVDGADMVFTHYPFDIPMPYINVHGHEHAGGYTTHFTKSLQHINVNCEFHSYRPEPLTEIIRIAKLRTISAAL